LAGISVEKGIKFKEMGHLFYSLSTLVVRYTAHAKTKLDISTYGLVWEKGIMLEDCRDVALVRRD
jgi:hypothetical protein